MRRLFIAVGVVATVATLGVSTVEAQRLGGPGGRRPGIGGPARAGVPLAQMRALRQLDLSAEQKAQVKDILAKTRGEVGPLLRQLREKRQAVRQSIQAGTPPDTARAEAQEGLAELRKQVLEARQKTHTALRGVLTPAQVDKLKTLRPRATR
jgi:Spy/CpxP family protein refolding chaperone